MSKSDAQDTAAIAWLMGSDPAIRWQVMRDLLDAPEADWSAERQKVETQGWGARLLWFQDADGQWAGGAFRPAGFTREEFQKLGQPWTATSFCISQLREFGLDPNSEAAKRTVALIGQSAYWEEGGQPFWDGEVEECIDGRLLADGAYFGVDMSAVVVRLLADRLGDGGWNCERCNGSHVSSFASTINVLEGLLEFEKQTGGTVLSRAARKTGEDYLLKRQLFRCLSTGAPADEAFRRFMHPNRWRYDILRALDYFRAAALFENDKPDARLGAAIHHVQQRQLADGRWRLDSTPHGPVWFDVDDGVGQLSRWITLRALRVLKWWDDAAKNHGAVAD